MKQERGTVKSRRRRRRRRRRSGFQERGTIHGVGLNFENWNGEIEVVLGKIVNRKFEIKETIGAGTRESRGLEWKRWIGKWKIIGKYNCTNAFWRLPYDVCLFTK